ncbi:hypothetical protein ACK9YZ_20235 [Rhizobium sp. ZK1]|uniref:hypothetical protein n=1 Tax=Rhizobium sp. ZK1 TaxID=3389872 RepID=UPI0039F7361A
MALLSVIFAANRFLPWSSTGTAAAIGSSAGCGRLDVMSLKQGEWILAPDLVYAEAA